MPEAGLSVKDDGSVVVTVIFQGGELEGYIDRAEQAGESVPVETGETVQPPADETQPADETPAEPGAEETPAG